MGAVFRKSKKKKAMNSVVQNQATIPSKSEKNGKKEENNPEQKKEKKKKGKKNEETTKIMPITETIHENFTSNENKEKDLNEMEVFDKINDISSIKNQNEASNESNEMKENKNDMIFSNKDSKEETNNDLVEENNLQMENNPNFLHVLMKDPKWANANIAKKLQEFNWPDKGFVEIKTVGFEIKYDYNLKGFKVLRNNESLNSSILSWVKMEQEEYFSFDLKDINSFNLKTGQAIQNKRMNDGLKFGVDFHGKYLGLEFDDNSKNKIESEMISFLDVEIEDLWSSLVGNWISLNFKDPTNKLHGKNTYFGKEAVSLSKESFSEPDSIINFLVEKFKDPAGLKMLMKSPNLIPNNLKKWQEYEISSNVFDIRKLKFYMAENYTNYSALVELNKSRPFLVNIEKTKKLIFEYDGDLFADVSQNLKMMVILWKDLKETQKEEYLLSEVSSFHDLCLDNLKQILIEISDIQNLPLNYRPKAIEETFNLDNNNL